VWGGELGAEGGEEGGLGMGKATGGKTQHGNPFLPPTVRALLSAEHSVRAGAQTATLGPAPAPRQRSHSRSGAGPRGARENEQLWQKESKCQVLERFEGRYFNRRRKCKENVKKSCLVSSFVRCPSSLRFKSRLTPMTKRALSTKHFSRPGK